MLKNKMLLPLVLGSFILLSGGVVSAGDAGMGSVAILSPENGAIVHETSIEVLMKIDKGMSGDHIHFYLDGESLGVVRGDKKRLEKLTKGSHTIEGMLTSKGHEELGPKATSTFTVQ